MDNFYGLIVYHYMFQVCVDVFITTQTYVDIASISVIPRTTGGQVLKNVVTYMLFLCVMYTLTLNNSPPFIVHFCLFLLDHDEGILVAFSIF